MPIDEGVGSDATPLPRRSKKRERAEARINAWLSQVGTEELLDLANFLTPEPPAEQYSRELANELASAIPRLLLPIKHPPAQITLDKYRAPIVPKFRSLPKKTRDLLRAELPNGAPLEHTYNAIQNALFIYATSRWITHVIANFPRQIENIDILKDIHSPLKKLIKKLENAPIRIWYILESAPEPVSLFANAYSAISALREIEKVIAIEVRLQRRKKVGPPKKRGYEFDDLGERLMERWEASTGQKPTSSRKTGGLIAFASKLTKVDPIRAEAALRMSFPGSNRTPLVETFSASLSEKDIAAAVEGAMRARRTEQSEATVAGSE
ncbi:MAG: hypothetical protein WC068_08315 [Caulobacter sp.]